MNGGAQGVYLVQENSLGADGIILIQFQAVRGLLIHRLELRQGRVYD
jgi:hypothetical protein